MRILPSAANPRARDDGNAAAVGERIALAGRVWVITELDYKRKLILSSLSRRQVPAFSDFAPAKYTRVLERHMTGAVRGKIYPYLMKNARDRRRRRGGGSNTGMAESPLVFLRGETWCSFPWLGTYSFLALERFLKLKCAKELEYRRNRVSASVFYNV